MIALAGLDHEILAKSIDKEASENVACRSRKKVAFKVQLIKDVMANLEVHRPLSILIDCIDPIAQLICEIVLADVHSPQVRSQTPNVIQMTRFHVH